MVTRYTVVQDGQVYEPGDDVPDMGSITALESKGNYREYNALSKDIDKLPTYVYGWKVISNDSKSRRTTARSCHKNRYQRNSMGVLMS